MLNIGRIDHIGVAVRDIEKAAQFWEGVLGIKMVKTEQIEDQNVLTAMFPIGDSEIELLQASSDQSPISKFIDKNGEGVHHIAFEVDDINIALSQLANCDVSLIDLAPRDGANESKIAFLHPNSTNGVLVELCQRTQRGK